MEKHMLSEIDFCRNVLGMIWVEWKRKNYWC